MSATVVLIHLVGEVALLLWGIQMVNGGVLSAYGSDLRWTLGRALRTRVHAFLAGLGATTVLQSSTATALMAASFLGGGVVDLVPALALMLGANIGSTLIVQLLSFDVSMVFPALIFVGVVLARRGGSSRSRDLGKAAIGLGLMLLALHLLGQTMEGLESAPALGPVLAALTPDPVFAFLLAAALSWAAHSSVVAMLFILSLAGAGVVPPATVLAMVLGANFGTALNPLLEVGRGEPAAARLALGNFLIRLAGCLVALPLLPRLLALMQGFDPSSERLGANFHTLFNVALALVFIGALPLVARGLGRLLPDKPQPADPATPRYLDPAALGTPPVALANAAREILRMADVVDEMLRNSRELFHRDDRGGVGTVSRMDDVLDRLYAAIRSYIAAIDQDALGEEDRRRLSDILLFAINLEHVGDIIDKNLMELADKRIKNHVRLPDENLGEIDGMHAQLMEHLQLAASVLMFQDVGSARRLVIEKERFRDLERAVTRRHLSHMRGGDRRLIEAGALQLDIVRDLKRIEAHIASMAHSLLERSGQLMPSRLAG